MASRYLLVEFDDEQSATNLRAKLDAATMAGSRYRVVGLFAKPTAYCQCDTNGDTASRTNPGVLRRGRKFGWWVCVNCKRPTSALAGLRNLLRPSDIVAPPSWVQGGHHWTHYIPTLSGLALGAPGRRFWDERP